MDTIDLLRLAKKLVTSSNYEAAREILFALAKVEKTNPEVFNLIAESFIKEDNLKNALVNLNTVNTLVNLLPGYDELKLKTPTRIEQIQGIINRRLENEKNDKLAEEENKRKIQESFSSQNLGKPDSLLSADTLEMGHKELGTNERHVYHPYFGFIQRPGKRGSHYYNNYGFAFRDEGVDYPHVGSTNNALIVGIFGGSVPDQMLQSQRNLIANELKSVAKGREILLLPFAQGGWEQPQAYLALAYFASIGQRFDIVVNLDGFNEAVGKRLTQSSGYHPAMPQYNIIKDLRLLFQPHKLGHHASNYMGTLLKSRSRVEWSQSMSKNTVLAPFFKPLASYYKNRYDNLIHKAPEIKMGNKDDIFILHERPSIGKEDLKDPKTKNRLATEVINLWRQSSLLMSGISEKIGAKYIHALMPSVYFSNKPISNEEKNSFYRPNSFQSKMVSSIYPKMVDQVSFFNEKKVNFLDLTSVFDKVEETVMADDVCHFNSTGYRYIALKLSHHLVHAEV